MTIFGWDASHYDDPPDAARMIREGFSFFTHKAGGDGNDPELAATWKNVKPYRATHIAFNANGDSYYAASDGSPGVLVGAYWVVRPDLHGNASDDADAFLARLDSQCPGWRDAWFILQADCESWGDSSGRKKPNKAHIKVFCDRLRAKAPKLMPLVYASKGDYGDSLAGLGYPLWNARYSLSYQTGTASGLYARALAAGSGWVEYSGQMPPIWQFTSSATIAGQTTCDANAYRGTLAQLASLVAPGWEDDVEPVDLLQYDPNDPALGIPNDFNDKATNKTVSVRTAIYNGYSIPKKIADTQLPALQQELDGRFADLEAKLDALAAKVDALGAQQLPADLAGQIADILAQRLSA